MNSTGAVIIDDEPGARALVRNLLKKHFPDIPITGEAAGVEEGYDILQRNNGQLIFLDVEMDDGTGFQLLDRLPDLKDPVIFTTAHDEFALKAFRYHALDYLLKPIDPDEFINAVNKARKQVYTEVIRKQLDELSETTRTKEFDRITLSTSAGFVFTSTRKITRIETYGNYSFVFLAESERLLVSRNLKEFEEMLPEPDFFRIHQSHIVNTGFVKKYIKEDGGYVVMEDNSKIPVSRRRKEEFLNMLFR